jgi:hypothetical protein
MQDREPSEYSGSSPEQSKRPTPTEASNGFIKQWKERIYSKVDTSWISLAALYFVIDTPLNLLRGDYKEVAINALAAVTALYISGRIKQYQKSKNLNRNPEAANQNDGK